MQIQLREPRTPDELSAYYNLRWRVLRKPWGGERVHPPDAGNGGAEAGAFHLTAWDGPRIAGCGRLEFSSPGEARVRGIAVDPDYQGKGIGSMILSALEAHAARIGLERLVLDGRENALGFYRRNGYECGEESHTLYGVVRHWRMWKDIGPVHA